MANRRWKRTLRERDLLGWRPREPGRKARHRLRLTDEFVDALSTKVSEETIRDWELPQLGIRVRATGTKTFIYRPLCKGTKKLITLGRFPEMCVAEARAGARDVERRLSNGGRIAEFTSPKSTRTVEEAYRVYIETWHGSAAWRRKIGATFDQDILAAIGTTALAKLQAQDIRKALSDCLSPCGRRQRMYIVSAFLTWCTQTGRVDTNVLKGGPSTPKPPRQRDPIRLDYNDLCLVWDACEQLPKQWADAVRLAMSWAMPIDLVLKLDANGRVNPDGPVQCRAIAPTFARAYFEQVAQGRDGWLFVARGKSSPMKFQSRIVERLRSEFPWPCRFSIGDIVSSASRELTDLRSLGMQWDELHPRFVYDPNPSPVEDDEVEI